MEENENVVGAAISGFPLLLKTQVARLLILKGRRPGSVQSSARLLERHPNIVKKLNKGLIVREVAEIVGKSTTTVMKVKKVLEKA